MKITTLFFCLLISLSIQAQKLTIYTYDSFVSEWGPGPIIKEKLKKILILN
jgi:ABC-type thiamine transport system, periplasmic component